MAFKIWPMWQSLATSGHTEDILKVQLALPDTATTWPTWLRRRQPRAATAGTATAQRQLRLQPIVTLLSRTSGRPASTRTRRPTRR